MKDRGGELFLQMYEENVDRVYAFFGYRTGSKEAAEDLTQSTFEKAFRSWALFDETLASAGTWLMTIARNALIDSYRREGSRNEEPLADDEMPEVGFTEEHDLGVSPELETALGELDDKQRELIALRFGADLTGPEIADLTGLSLDNVHQILSRTLRRMRKVIGEPEKKPEKS